MAASAVRSVDDLKDDDNISSKSLSNEKIKFKDPLLTGLDKDSDDDGVSSNIVTFLKP